MRHDRILVTERLVLRPLAERDAAAFHAISIAPGAMQFWSTGPHRSLAESEALIARMLAGTERAWVLSLTPDGDAIGLVQYLGNDGVPGMGYLMHPEYWGRGLMAEAVRAALDHGFDELGLTHVELWIDARNMRSRKLAERLGFTGRSAFRQKYDRDRESHEKLVYGLRIAEWKSGRELQALLPVRPYGLQPVLGVQDVSTTADFYRDMLGFRIGFLYGDPPSYGAVSFSEWTATGAQIHLRRIDHPPVAHDLSLYINVGPGIEHLYALYRERGVTMVSAPKPQPWQVIEFEVRDCNGYRLCFSTAC